MLCRLLTLRSVECVSFVSKQLLKVTWLYMRELTVKPTSTWWNWRIFNYPIRTDATKRTVCFGRGFDIKWTLDYVRTRTDWGPSTRSLGHSMDAIWNRDWYRLWPMISETINPLSNDESASDYPSLPIWIIPRCHLWFPNTNGILYCQLTILLSVWRFIQVIIKYMLDVYSS